MKICWISGAESIHDQRFFEKLAEKGYEIHVISIEKNLMKTRAKLKLKNLKGVIFYNLPLAKLHTKPLFDKLIIYIKAAIFMRKIVGEIKPDIIISFLLVEKYGFIAALTGFHPFILFPGGSDILISSKESFLIRLIQRFTIRKADMIQCDAEIVKKELLKIQKYQEEKIKVFPQLGIDMKKFNATIKENKIKEKLGWQNKKILIMTRELKPVYDIETFLKSIKYVIKEFPDTGVILCGDGNLRDKLELFVKENNLSEYIYFAGHVANDELATYLNAANIYVSCSLSDGTPLSLLEAMCCGLPLVMTDVPAVMEWVKNGKNGFIVQKKNPELLAKAIIKLLKNKKLQMEFSKKNIEIAKEKADINVNFKKLEEMFNKLVKPDQF